MSQSKFLGKLLCWLISVAALGLFYSPIYAHHVPGKNSATVEISIANTSCETTHPPLTVGGPSRCKITLTTSSTLPNRLNCRENSTTRNVTCNLPQPFVWPTDTAVVATYGKFEFKRTTLATDPVTGAALGAEFVASCNASSDGKCNTQTDVSFQSTAITKLSATTSAAQKVQVKFGYTMGLMPDNINDNILDPTTGFAFAASTRGSFLQPSGLLLNGLPLQAAVNDTAGAAFSYTYVQSGGNCGTSTLAGSTPEPFSISGCTKETVVPCIGTPASALATCNATGAEYRVSANSTTANSVINGLTNLKQNKIELADLTQKNCGAIFVSTNVACRPIVRLNSTTTHGFVRMNDKFTITESSRGTSGLIPEVLAVSAGEGLACSINESNERIGEDQGQFKMRVIGGAVGTEGTGVDTTTMTVENTFFGLPGGTTGPGGGLVQVADIRLANFNDDNFPDVWVIVNNEDVLAAGINCAQFPNGETLTLILKSKADVIVRGDEYLVAGAPVKGNKGEGTKNFGPFAEKRFVPVSCEIFAAVGPCPGQ